jgi:hypothetical protein
MKLLRLLFLRMHVFGTILRARGCNPVKAKWKQKGLQLLIRPALALCLCSLPATATVVFSDSGLPGNTYDTTTVWNVCGDNGCGSMTIADRFSVVGSGNESVTEIDLAVGNVIGLNTFYAEILADNGGTPGTPVANAYWNLTTFTSVAAPCCSMVPITGITGVTLTAGKQYFMVIGPQSTSDSSFNGWFYNNQSVDGMVLASTDGGSTWSGSSSTLGAFDVLSTPSGTPEPGSLLLFVTGLAGMLIVCGRKISC